MRLRTVSALARAPGARTAKAEFGQIRPDVGQNWPSAATPDQIGITTRKQHSPTRVPGFETKTFLAAEWDSALATPRWQASVHTLARPWSHPNPAQGLTSSTTPSTEHLVVNARGARAAKRSGDPSRRMRVLDVPGRLRTNSAKPGRNWVYVIRPRLTNIGPLKCFLKSGQHWPDEAASDQHRPKTPQIYPNLAKLGRSSSKFAAFHKLRQDCGPKWPSGTTSWPSLKPRSNLWTTAPQFLNISGDRRDRRASREEPLVHNSGVAKCVVDVERVADVERVVEGRRPHLGKCWVWTRHHAHLIWPLK